MTSVTGVTSCDQMWPGPDATGVTGKPRYDQMCPFVTRCAHLLPDVNKCDKWDQVLPGMIVVTRCDQV